ncbi:hypothetical protein Esti_002754 [Eimeria stiedai]
MLPEDEPVTGFPNAASVLDEDDQIKKEGSHTKNFVGDGLLRPWGESNEAWLSRQHDGTTASSSSFSPSASLEEGWGSVVAPTEMLTASRDRRTLQQTPQGYKRGARSSRNLLTIAFCLMVATLLLLRATTLRKQPITRAHELQAAGPVKLYRIPLYQRAFTKSVTEFKRAWASAPTSAKRIFVATHLPLSSASQEALDEVPTPLAQFIDAFTQASLPAKGSKEEEEGERGVSLKLQLRAFTAVLQAAKHRLTCIADWQRAPKEADLPSLEKLLEEKEACMSLSEFLKMMGEELSDKDRELLGAEEKSIPSVLAAALLQEMKNSELQWRQDKDAVGFFLPLVQQLSPSEAKQQEAQPGPVPGLPDFEFEKIREAVNTYAGRRRRRIKPFHDADCKTSAAAAAGFAAAVLLRKDGHPQVETSMLFIATKVFLLN